MIILGFVNLILGIISLIIAYDMFDPVPFLCGFFSIVLAAMLLRAGFVDRRNGL